MHALAAYSNETGQAHWRPTLIDAYGLADLSAALLQEGNGDKNSCCVLTRTVLGSTQQEFFDYQRISQMQANF
ncbi:hypothetical protein GCM10028819_46600 [Spirosoma humi]